MSASIAAPLSAPSGSTRLRFGRVHAAADALARESGASKTGSSIEWLLKRNCSLRPQQLLAVYASLCVISLSIATYFWVNGATLVMPFAWAELLVVGAALLVYARHATDRELITLQSGRLIVEHLHGGRIERAEFQPDWVRVEPRLDDRSLIELSGQGHVIAVGRYVRPELRPALADEFRATFRQWPEGRWAAAEAGR
jgi:uncharacterized membrane protein